MPHPYSDRLYFTDMQHRWQGNRFYLEVALEMLLYRQMFYDEQIDGLRLVKPSRVAEYTRDYEETLNQISTHLSKDCKTVSHVIVLASRSWIQVSTHLKAPRSDAEIHGDSHLSLFPRLGWTRSRAVDISKSDYLFLLGRAREHGSLLGDGRREDTDPDGDGNPTFGFRKR